jgi:enolase
MISDERGTPGVKIPVTDNSGSRVPHASAAEGATTGIREAAVLDKVRLPY